MKKYILLALSAIIFAGCAEDNEVIITNLSGVNWYDTQIWYTNSKDAMQGYTEVGSVSVGESCSVDTECQFIVVSARDSRGRLVMSDYMDADNGIVTVKDGDLLR